VRRIEYGYDSRGNISLITTYDAPGGGNVVNQIKREFNGLGHLISEWQEHGGAVTGRSPRVQYAYSAMADGANRTRLKAIVQEFGWPGKSLVGADGANAAWLLIQHADADREFQKDCLRLMEAAPAGEVEGKHIAYLTDRVLVGAGKPQKYGTQLGADFKPLPIADEGNVDDRRAKLGLPSLAEYIKTAKAEYEKATHSAAEKK
jgi:hypothetical protein